MTQPTRKGRASGGTRATGPRDGGMTTGDDSPSEPRHEATPRAVYGAEPDGRGDPLRRPPGRVRGRATIGATAPDTGSGQPGAPRPSFRGVSSLSGRRHAKRRVRAGPHEEAGPAPDTRRPRHA